MSEALVSILSEEYKKAKAGTARENRSPMAILCAMWNTDGLRM
jgi:hypothetical protein